MAMFFSARVAYWLTYPFILLVLIAPVVYWFTGISAISDRNEEAALVLLPRFIANTVLIYWLSERKVVFPVIMVHKVLPAFHLTAALAKALIAPFGRPFKVTAKGQKRDGIVVQWSLLWIFLTLAAAILGGMLTSLTGFYEIVPFNHASTLDVVWSVYSLLLLFLVALACIELPKGAGSMDRAGVAIHGDPAGALKALLKRMFA
jgi:cellulose synthase (UDP-forming)